MMASLRSGPIGRLRLVRGARCSAKASRQAGQVRCARRSVAIGSARLDSARSSPWVRRRRLSDNSSPADGTGAGVQGRPAGPAASAARSKSAPKAATPATPSAMAWCIRRNRPTCPRGRPGKNHASHSGREGSSRCRRNCSHASKSCGCSPGAGSGKTRTWSASSKEGASTHSGQPSPRRGRYNSCRKRGSRCILGPIASRTASIRNRPSRPTRPAPSTMISAPMSPGQP